MAHGKKSSLLRSLLDVLESVLDLVSFSISPRDKHQSNSAQPPQNTAGHVTNSGPDCASAPLRVVIESGPPPRSQTEDEKNQSEREEKRKNDAEERDKTRLVVEVALAIFTSLLLLVNVWLVLTTRNQSQLLRQQLIGTQAAIVAINGPISVGPDGIRKNTNVSISLKNDGHVNAVSIVVKLKARVIQLPENTPMGKQWDCEETIPVLAPTQVPQILPIYVQCFLDDLTDEDLKQISELTRTVAIDGEYIGCYADDSAAQNQDCATSHWTGQFVPARGRRASAAFRSDLRSAEITLRPPAHRSIARRY